MIKAPTIHASPQARLLLYRLFASKISATEERLLAADPILWEQLLQKANDEIDVQKKSDREILNQAFVHIDSGTRDGLQKQIKRLSGLSLWLGAYPTSFLDAFVNEHLDLLKSVQRDQLEKIGLAIQRGIREGRMTKELIQDIRDLTALSKRRARLIARNAPLQFSGALTKHHQMSAGITSYTWQSSRDERVRDAHRKFDGEIFNWKGRGPHPRSEVNCRCDAIPFLTKH